MRPKSALAVLAVIAVAVAAFALGRGQEPATTGLASEEAVNHESMATAVIPGAEHVHSLAYAEDGRLLLGAHGGLFASGDRGASWQEQATSGDVTSSDFMALVPHPSERGVLFAAGHDLGVVKSTDGGRTWQRSDAGIDGTDIHALAINQRQPEYLFAFSTGKGVFRSTDGGRSWHRLDDGPPNPGVRVFAYMAVQTDMDRSMGSDNWGLLFAGTADGVYDSYSCFCGWRETTKVFDGTTVYALATLSENLGTMWAGTNEGVWKSEDEGKSWDRLEGVDGRVTAIAINPTDAEEVMAATESGEIFLTGDGGRSWTRPSRRR